MRYRWRDLASEVDGNAEREDNGSGTQGSQKGERLPKWPDPSRDDHEGRRPNVVIVQHCAHSAKQYAQATPFPGHLFAVPDRCPHPECRAADALIRWGTYERQARTGLVVYDIRVQRVRCKVCGRTHSLLPDFLHPYRHYVISLLQRVVFLYILTGLGINRLIECLIGQGPVRSTIREWIASFAYGAGHLLFDLLLRFLMAVNPLVELPETPMPMHLDRVPSLTKRYRLGRAHRFVQLTECLYAQIKDRVPHLHFTPDQMFSFVLHCLQCTGVPPRIFWSPRLSTTPTEPF